jgi:hypothetical protein
MIMLKQRAVLATTTAAQGDCRAGVRWNAREVYLKLRVGAPGMREQAEDRLLAGERVAGAVQRRERTESERNRAQSSCITTRLTARHEKRRTGGGT